MYLLTIREFSRCRGARVWEGRLLLSEHPPFCLNQLPHFSPTATSRWGASGHWNPRDQSTLQRGGSEPRVPVSQHSGCVAGRLVLPRAERTHCVHDRCLKTAVPNLWGTRKWFHGRQFFMDWGRDVSFRAIQTTLHSLCTLSLLLLVHKLHLRLSGISSWRLGTPALKAMNHHIEHGEKSKTSP